MFEDSTFESTGRIRTRSRGWMIAALLVDTAILLALILIPLIDPEALPHQMALFLMTAPASQPTPDPQPVAAAQAFHGEREMRDNVLFAPPHIPTGVAIYKDGPEQAPGGDIAGLGGENGVPGADGPAFHGPAQPRVVHLEKPAVVRVAEGVEAGLLIRKTIPQYPPIARTTRQEGTVVLAATISKYGTIENLRIVSGPPLLQQAALDAVRTWVYKPYLLDGEPVDVQTTVNVIFRLGN